MTRTVTAVVLGEVEIAVPDHLTEPCEIREYISDHANQGTLTVSRKDIDELWADNGDLIAGWDDR